MIKNCVKVTGLLVLTFFSFFYTEKTVNTIKNQDPLMMEINELKNTYKVDVIESSVSSNSIIPGMIGCEVDVQKSYTNLKRLGSFSSNLLVYKDILPNVLLENSFDKYIVKGNKEKNTVSLIFKVNEDDKIDDVLNILDDKKVKASFFIDGNFIENNVEKIKSMIKDNQEVLNYGFNGKYDEDLMAWNNNFIERINYDNPKWCYIEKEDSNVLDLCSKNKMHTLIPTISIKTNPLKEVRDNIEKGSLIAFNINDTTINELRSVINYINQKGYSIDVVSKHLKEEKLNNCKK